MVGVEAEYAADGVAAIEQGRRSLDDLSTVDGKLVNLQPVVVAPLLSLVLDTVLRNGQTVEP